MTAAIKAQYPQPLLLRYALIAPWGISEAAALHGDATASAELKANVRGSAHRGGTRHLHQHAADVPPRHPIARLNPNRPPFEARYNKVGLMANHVSGEADKPDYMALMQRKHNRPQPGS